jgi:DNA-binding protein HU-beta
MNKSDLVDALADSAGMTKADASRALDALFGSRGVIARALRADQRVQITGFATIHIAASKTPGFRAGKGFKDAIQ